MIFKLTAFLGSFLLFFLEILAPQTLLPIFGGSHSVFITSLVFFTGMLFLSNLSLHILARRVALKNLLVGLLMASICAPLLLFFEFEMTGTPTYFNVLFYLVIKFGPLFFLLSLVSPLIQVILGHLKTHNDANIYEIYSYSNIGSFIGLFSGPLLIDYFLNTNEKLYLLCALFILTLLLMAKIAKGPWDRQSTPSESFQIDQVVDWLIFSSIPTLFMISSTNFLLISFGNIPLVWAFPLSILLLSFILAFRAENRLDNSKVLLLGAVLFILSEVGSVLLPGLKAYFEFLNHLTILFVISSIALNRLYLTKPKQENLTLFYSVITLGGFLGALALGIGVPLLFKDLSSNILEYFFSTIVLFIGILHHSIKPRAIAIILPSLFIGFYFLAHYTLKDPTNLKEYRSFYGLLKAKQNKDQIEFFHNNTIHGLEVKDEEVKRPYVYYFEESPIGEVFNALTEIKDVAVIGVGVGSVLFYSKKDQNWDLFELDPKVIKLARDQFSFIKQSEAKLNFVIEDGRQALLKSQKKYDLIIIDVFNGPQIPYHFLTKEAFELYQSHIKPDGVLAFHASNSVYNFVPLLSKTSQILGLSFYSNSFTPDKSEGPQKYYPNRWYFAGRNSALIKGLSQKAGALKTYNQVNKDLKIWRDDFFPLSSILF